MEHNPVHMIEKVNVIYCKPVRIHFYFSKSIWILTDEFLLSTTSFNRKLLLLKPKCEKRSKNVTKRPILTHVISEIEYSKNLQ